MIRTSVKYNQIWNIAYPIILGSIAQNIINVTDTAFLGRVGEIELGAAAIGGLLYYVFVMLGFGYGTGTQIIIARRNGEKRYDEIGATSQHSFYFLLLIAILGFIGLKFISPLILDDVLQSKNIFEKSNEYLSIRSFGIFFVFANTAFRSFFVGIEKTSIITYSTFVITIVNVILDYIMIFGHLGFEPMGIKGAALASFIAEISGTVFFVIYTMNKSDIEKYRLFKIASLSLSLLKNISKTALPVMIQYFVSLGGWFLFFLFVERMGEHELAISNIIRNAYIVLLIPVWGFASAANTLVSNSMGRGRSDEVLHLIFKVAAFCTLLVIAIISVSYIFSEQILSVFTNDLTLIADSIPVYDVVLVSALALGIGMSIFNGVSGTGKTIVALVIELMVIVFYLTFVYFMSIIPDVEVWAVWTSEFVYGLLITILSLLYLRYGNWKSASI